MSEQEKLEYIAESVEMEVDDLSLDMVLAELDNWDSVAVLSIIAIINEKFDRYPTAEEILSYKTINDLIGAMN